MWKYTKLVTALLYFGAYMLRDESDIAEKICLIVVNMIMWAATAKLLEVVLL